jgi:ABC-2 type transport system permease protein
MIDFSVARFLALLRKEWLQIKRDQAALRLIIIMPIMQLLLYGYAINSNPKHLPTGVLFSEPSRYERSIVAALQNTGYFDVRTLSSEYEAERGLAQGKLLFVINVPGNFDRSVDRGEVPSILVDADGTDPTAIGSATGALGGIVSSIDRDVPPGMQSVAASTPFQFVIHARYNPEQITVLNIAPGLICIVLMMSTLFLTTLAITRERERGTMENLLAMPVRPIEVLLAKIVPFVAIGYLQVVMILAVSAILFQLPVRGSVSVLMLALGVFIAANLALGVGISTLARNQTQAVQMAQLMIMPMMLLSGFIFPFQGMPVWAQWFGEVIPTTHAMRIVRGVLLKGNGGIDVMPDLWPIGLFTLLVVLLAVKFYREHLE